VRKTMAAAGSHDSSALFFVGFVMTYCTAVDLVSTGGMARHAATTATL
jgi:hypothetical protein